MGNRMKKILMLGGSNCQRNGIVRGRELGYEMIVADYLEAPQAIEYASKHIKVSTFDKEGCIRAGKELSIDGVMTIGTDQPVLTAALVSKALLLPSNLTPYQAKAFTNKKVMKRIFVNKGIKTLPHRLINEKDHI